VAPAQAATVPAYDHVFVIVMENHAYGQIIGSSAAPYVNSLLPSNGLAANYFAVSHPSLPNYLALAGGSTYGITSDCTTCWISATNIADNLEARGSTWKAYMEAMPSPCFIGDSYPYAQKHNPFVYFNDIRTNTSRCRAHDVPYSQLATDLASSATTPNYAFITPDMCHDTHDCTVATGDSWLRSQVPQILNSAAFKTQRSLLALTWDEDDSSGSNRVATVFLGAGVGAGTRSGSAYNHYSLLRTIEAARGLATLTSNDAGASQMSDMFTTGVPTATPCTSVRDSTTPSANQLSFTATASGCPHPQYEFWILAPGSPTWQVMQSYSTTASFNWNTSGLQPGTYHYTAWARDASSSGTFCGNLGCNDAYSPSTAYSLGTQHCASVTDVASPAAPQLAGTSITFRAAASGCPNPLYQFWVLAPGSQNWQIGQPYSTMSAFSWNTSGHAAGNYLYTVWARDAGSAGDTCGNLGCHDSYFPATSFALTTQACTSVSDATSLGSPQPSGTTITFTASASGCPHPMYQFWVLAPGSHLWHVGQAYSATNTFAWNTSGMLAGVYLYTVWARDSGSTGNFCGNLGCSDAYSPATGYTLATRPCTSVTEGASPRSPQLPGTSVTFTAGASGCLHPLYQFWVLAPGSTTWQVLRAYSTTSSFTWNTGGLLRGTYLYTVWARDASSSGSSCGNLGCEDVYFPATSFTLS